MAVSWTRNRLTAKLGIEPVVDELNREGTEILLNHGARIGWQPERRS